MDPSAKKPHPQAKKDDAHVQAKPLEMPKVAAPADDQAARINELEDQVKRLTDIAGRAQADLQNAKMRLEKSGEELRKYAAESFLKRLLPTVDNFQRAFLHLPEELKSHEWVRGVTAIEQELLRQLSEMGLKKIDALGKPLDTTRHEVLLQGPGDEGKVLEVFEDGYELHGRVLRPAKVKIGTGEEQKKQGSEELSAAASATSG